MTWGVVLYPAWDEWTEADPGARAAVEAWLAEWVKSGPPPDAEQVTRVLELTGTELRYNRATHGSTGVVATFIVGKTGDQTYAAIIELRSPFPPASGAVPPLAHT